MKRRWEYGGKDGRSTEIPSGKPGELADHFGIRIVAIAKAVDQLGALGRKLNLGLCPVHRVRERHLPRLQPIAILPGSRSPVFGDRANTIAAIKMFVRHTHDQKHTSAPLFRVTHPCVAIQPQAIGVQPAKTISKEEMAEQSSNPFDPFRY